MPLGSNVGKNIEELYADNKKSGMARGANGKPRSRAQIIAIAMNAAHKGYHSHDGTVMTHKGKQKMM